MLSGKNVSACEDAFIESSFYNDNDTLLIYASFESEPDTFRLIESALEDNKSVFLPKVFGETMSFYKIFNTKDLIKGSFNIKEPTEGILYDGSNAICIVPGLAFDKSGNRLGFGKGYYDKFLSVNPHLIKIGFCAGCCFADSIPAQSNDIPMNYIFIDDTIFGI